MSPSGRETVTCVRKFAALTGTAGLEASVLPSALKATRRAVTSLSDVARKSPAYREIEVAVRAEAPHTSPGTGELAVLRVGDLHRAHVRSDVDDKEEDEFAG